MGAQVIPSVTKPPSSQAHVHFSLFTSVRAGASTASKNISHVRLYGQCLQLKNAKRCPNGGCVGEVTFDSLAVAVMVYRRFVAFETSR